MQKLNFPVASPNFFTIPIIDYGENGLILELSVFAVIMSPIFVSLTTSFVALKITQDVGKQ